MIRHDHLHSMIKKRIETLPEDVNMIELLNYLKQLKLERQYWVGGVDDDNFDYNELIEKIEILISSKRNRKIDQLLQADQISQGKDIWN